MVVVMVVSSHPFASLSNVFKRIGIMGVIQFECGKYPKIFCGILSTPQNIVMDLNNVMLGHHISNYI